MFVELVSPLVLLMQDLAKDIQFEINIIVCKSMRFPRAQTFFYNSSGPITLASDCFSSITCFAICNSSEKFLIHFSCAASPMYRLSPFMHEILHTAFFSFFAQSWIKTLDLFE